MLKNNNILLYLLIIVAILNVGCSTLSGDKESGNASKKNDLREPWQLNVDSALKAHLTAGVQYLGAGEMGPAHRHLKRALELDASSVQVHNALAIFYQAEGDSTREEFHFKKGLEIDPENSSLKHNYGSSLCRRGLYESSRAYLTSAAADYHYEGRAESYQNLGICERQAGNDSAAFAAFEDAYRLNKNLPKVVLGLSQFRLEKGDNHASYELYARYLKMATQNAESLWLGIRLERIFGDKNALASYELALRKRFPGSKEFKLYRANSPTKR